MIQSKLNNTLLVSLNYSCHMMFQILIQVQTDTSSRCNAELQLNHVSSLSVWEEACEEGFYRDVHMEHLGEHKVLTWESPISQIKDIPMCHGERTQASFKTDDQRPYIMWPTLLFKTPSLLGFVGTSGKFLSDAPLLGLALHASRLAATMAIVHAVVQLVLGQLLKDNSLNEQNEQEQKVRVVC